MLPRRSSRAGAIGVTGEEVWTPGNHALEQHCRDEMQRYGTLENPFSIEYLDYLLELHGFDSITPLPRPERASSP